jgi:hypothetical protein
MPPLAEVHTLIARAVSIFTLLVTLFAVFRLIRNAPLGSDFWGAVVIGEGLIVVQAIVGVILLIQGAVPGRVIHYLYGVLTVLAWPAAYTYSREQDIRRETITWVLVSAFLFGLSLRAAGTGAPPG